MMRFRQHRILILHPASNSKLRRKALWRQDVCLERGLHTLPMRQRHSNRPALFLSSPPERTSMCRTGRSNVSTWPQAWARPASKVRSESQALFDTALQGWQAPEQTGLNNDSPFRYLFYVASLKYQAQSPAHRSGRNHSDPPAGNYLFAGLVVSLCGCGRKTTKQRRLKKR